MIEEANEIIEEETDERLRGSLVEFLDSSFKKPGSRWLPGVRAALDSYALGGGGSARKSDAGASSSGRVQRPSADLDAIRADILGSLTTATAAQGCVWRGRRSTWLFVSQMAACLRR